MAHAFFSRIGAGFLMSCMFVAHYGAGICAVFDFFSASSLFGQRRLLVACPCPHSEHFSVLFLLPLHRLDLDGCLPAQYMQV